MYNNRGNTTHFHHRLIFHLLLRMSSPLHPEQTLTLRGEHWPSPRQRVFVPLTRAPFDVVAGFPENLQTILSLHRCLLNLQYIVNNLSLS